jgi:hypothetical protein
VGLVADRRGEVDHGVGAAQGLALKVAIAESREVAERDLDVDSMTPEPPRVPRQGADVVAGAQQKGQKRPANGPARPGEEDHGAGLYPPFAEPNCGEQARIVTSMTPGPGV